jgi:hypothetical protein
VGENELVLSTMKEEMVVYIHLLQTLICSVEMSAECTQDEYLPNQLLNVFIDY